MVMSMNTYGFTKTQFPSKYWLLWHTKTTNICSVLVCWHGINGLLLIHQHCLKIGLGCVVSMRKPHYFPSFLSLHVLLSKRSSVGDAEGSIKWRKVFNNAISLLHFLVLIFFSFVNQINQSKELVGD